MISSQLDVGIITSVTRPILRVVIFVSDIFLATAEELPEGLEELKELVLKMGQRLNLPPELMTKLEKSVSRLVAQLAALMLDSDATVTMETLLNDLIEMTDVLIEPEANVGEWMMQFS